MGWILYEEQIKLIKIMKSHNKMPDILMLDFKTGFLCLTVLIVHLDKQISHKNADF